jgi:hypothetical protein
VDGDSGHDHNHGMYEVWYLRLKGKKNVAGKLGWKEGRKIKHLKKIRRENRMDELQSRMGALIWKAILA